MIARRLIDAVSRLLLAITLLYLAVAAVGGLIPRSGHADEARRDVTIFVRDNGVHADLLLPARAAGIDLHAVLPPAHVRDPRSARGWVAIGWGQREVYLETRRWRDLQPGHALRAVFGGPSLIHVEHGGPPAASVRVRPVQLSAAGYRRLVDTALAGLLRGRDGRPVPLPGRGYGADDVFYLATGRYSALRTCNQWTADALAAGGVRIGSWTPFSGGVLRWLPKE